MGRWHNVTLVTVPNPLRPSDPVEIAAGACVLLADHLELLAHQLREQALDDYARDRLADASERVRRALDVVTAALQAPHRRTPSRPRLPRPGRAPHRQAPAGRVPATATIVTWTRPRQRREGNRYLDTGQRVALKVHVSLDGSRTVCGSEVPDHATVMAPTVDWHLHTNCYNCAYRLWPDHRLVGYLRRPTAVTSPCAQSAPITKAAASTPEAASPVRRQPHATGHAPRLHRRAGGLIGGQRLQGGLETGVGVREQLLGPLLFLARQLGVLHVPRVEKWSRPVDRACQTS
ncbi:hypothetical protein ACFPOI_21880 [Nonomuraea angiospora]|uniref:Transposase n=1 Tax=Nonomuraea angiospora TaxID=46172 RepID=A0ABR9MK75_9ACTN|nr:hypothetical protein [Nonomuraea angiospora]MBE1593318.1 hypothetical protein [Nonomuraea angiospora]